MKTQKNILAAFILNLLFSALELAGGLWTGSFAILSDALHDMGDAMTIGLSYFLERKSMRPPDETHTYGYARYSVLGGVITSAILLIGSGVVIGNAIKRIITPAEINYRGMIVFAIVGASINLIAAFLTRDGDSLNQRAVNLHMLEDVLGWVVVLIGAVVMHFTDFAVLDPILSIGVAVFILINAAKNLKEAADLFLIKTPKESSILELQQHLMAIDGVKEVHHIHLWSLDGRRNCATVHVVATGEGHLVKDLVRQALAAHGICHATLELETEDEHCHEKNCTIKPVSGRCHHHHHH